MKSSGLNIEDTQLLQINRIKKLLSLAMLAFTWVCIVTYATQKSQTCKNQNDGKKTKNLDE